MARLTTTYFIMLATALSACGGGGGYSTGPIDQPGPPGPPPPPVSAATVRATPGLQFTPSDITLTVGGTITFQFESIEHDVFFDNAPAGAPANIAAATANTSITRTFTTPGRYVYNCHIHPGMSGVIVVQ